MYCFFFDVFLHYLDLEGLSYCGFSHMHQYLILKLTLCILGGVCFEVGVPAPNSKFIILNVGELGQNFILLLLPSLLNLQQASIMLKSTGDVIKR